MNFDEYGYPIHAPAEPEPEFSVGCDPVSDHNEAFAADREAHYRSLDDARLIAATERRVVRECASLVCENCAAGHEPAQDGLGIWLHGMSTLCDAAELHDRLRRLEESE